MLPCPLDVRTFFHDNLPWAGLVKCARKCADTLLHMRVPHLPDATQTCTESELRTAISDESTGRTYDPTNLHSRRCTFARMHNHDLPHLPHPHSPDLSPPHTWKRGHKITVPGRTGGDALAVSLGSPRAASAIRLQYCAKNSTRNFVEELRPCPPSVSTG